MRAKVDPPLDRFPPPRQRIADLGMAMSDPRGTPSIIKHPEAIWFLPICDDSHWFLARLDVANNNWELLNSMASRALDERVLAALDDLFRLLGLKLDANKPITPSTPQQRDNSSCGPAIINIVEKELLGEAAFDPARPKISRVRQFQRLLRDFPRRTQNTPTVENTANKVTAPTGVADDGLVEDEPLPSEMGRPPAKPRAGPSRSAATPQLRDLLPSTAAQRHRSTSSDTMRTRNASSVRRDEGGAPPMSSTCRSPRTATALSDITNLDRMKPNLSADKKRVPAGAHQRAPSNKATPSKAAATTASLEKPVKPVDPVKLLKPGKPEKSSGVDTVAEDDDALHASTHSSEGNKSPLGSDLGGSETESGYLQQPLKHNSQASSKRQRKDKPDDLSDRSEDDLLLPSGRVKKAARISDLDLHLADLSDGDFPIEGADQPFNPRPSVSSSRQHNSQASSKRQRKDKLDDLSDRSEDDLLLPSGRVKKAARISDFDLHLADLSDGDFPIEGADSISILMPKNPRKRRRECS